MTDDEKAVRAVVEAWFAALNAMLAGDAEPVAAIFSHDDDMIYMGGEGTYRIGYDAAFADWKEQAARSLGGSAAPADIRVIVSGDMATAALISHAMVNAPEGGVRQIRFRHTNVFRKEAGSWRMIVHHADNSPVWTDVVDR